MGGHVRLDHNMKSSPFYPSNLTTTNLSLIDVHIWWTFHINETIQYPVLCDSVFTKNHFKVCPRCIMHWCSSFSVVEYSVGLGLNGVSSVD